MMKSLILTLGVTWLFFVLELGGQTVWAQTPVGSVMPPANFTYYLQRSAVAGTNPVQYLWAVRSPGGNYWLDRVAFRSLAYPALRKWIIDWQHGNIPITYIVEKHSTRNPNAGASKKLAQELKDFSQFCHSQGEDFIIRSPQK